MDVFAPVAFLAAALCAHVVGAEPVLGARTVPEPHSNVRRVCVQMGVPTFRAPERSAAIAHSDGGPPARLGGGLYVQLTGLRQDGYVQVRTLKGAEQWVPELQPGSGTPALCAAQGSTMRVCRKDGPAEVPVYADFGAPEAAPVAFLKRGSAVQLWEYFEDRGRWTFVEIDGTVGFVRSEELCHDESRPPGAQATERFRMTAAPAKPDCYEWGRERSAAEIRRIVIHNSEAPIQATAALFQQCTPERPRSAHVGIDRDGTIYRFVEDKFAAFHTGGYDGGFNSVSLGIEVVAYGKTGFGVMTPPQERALLDLVRFWSKEYHITVADKILHNSTRLKTYNDVEFWRAPVSIHRLVSAGRATDCPTFIWPDNVRGDEEFFLWRRQHLNPIHGQ